MAPKYERPAVSKYRQRTALPPNFVHSLDATHMLMTCLACTMPDPRRGRSHAMAFAAVHDSFWTHAADTDDLHWHIRDQFVDLYKRPILEDFKETTEHLFPGIRLPPLPETGDLDLEVVRDAPFFFS